LKIVVDNYLNKEKLNSVIHFAIKRVHGERGLMEIDPHIISHDANSNEAVIRCRNSSVNKLRASLTLITNFDEYAISIFVLKASGTIKSLKKESKSQ
jgi:RNase P/RNase MRP subunit POP5